MKKLLLALVAILSVALPGLAGLNGSHTFYVNIGTRNWSNVYVHFGNGGNYYTAIQGVKQSDGSYKFTSGSWDNLEQIRFADSNNTSRTEYGNGMVGDIKESSTGAWKLQEGYIYYLADTGNNVTKSEKYESVKYYLDGAALNGWNKNDIELLKVGSTNVYKAVNVEIKAQDEFGVRAMDGSTQKAYYWAAGKNNCNFVNEVEKGKTYTQTISTVAQNNDNGTNFITKFTGKNYTFEFNLDNNTLTITGDGIKDPVVTPEVVKYALKGQMFGTSGGWDAKDLKSSNGKWVLEDVEFSNGNEFGIQGLNSSNEQKQWIYGETNRNEFSSACTLNTVIENTAKDNGKNWKYTGTKATYNVTFDPTANTLTIAKNGEDPLPGNKVTVYFNAGADWYSTKTMNQGRGSAETGAAGKVQACLIKKDGTSEAAKDMTNMMAAGTTTLPFFCINVENPDNYKGIIFQCKGANNQTWTYNSVKSAESYNNEGKSDYKESEWYRYIYATGGQKSSAAHDCAAEQSYLTYDQYVALRDNEKDAVYIVGGGFNSFEPTEVNGEQVFNLNSPKNFEDWKYNDANIGKAVKSDGVYLFPVTFKSDATDIYFKMSWIDAEKYRKELGAATQGTDGNGRDNRWWATFNLGIVGPTLPPVPAGRYYDDKGNEIWRQAFEDEIAQESSPNNNVSYKANRARSYSRYNQYNWWINKSSLSFGNNEVRWIVIDTEYETSALVPFRPAPSLSDVTAQNPSVYDGDLSAYAETLGNKLEGTATAGPARISATNTATGEATINVSPGISLFDAELGDGSNRGSGYDLTYRVYNGDDVIAEFKGVDGATSYKLTLDNMAITSGRTLSVRCIYHDKVNKTTFRSRREYASIEAEDKYNAPEAGDVSATLFLDGNGWCAHISVPFSIQKSFYKDGQEDKELIVYPDYSLNVTGDKWERLRLASNDDWHVGAGIGTANHTTWKEGEYIPATHNWAELSKKESASSTHNEYEFQFVLEGIAPASTPIDELPSRFNWQLGIKAAYPFLQNDMDDVRVEAFNGENKLSSARKVEVRKFAPRAGENTYSVLMRDVPTTVNVSADKSTDLSGITDAEIANGDGEAEYFNLQGVRVQGDIVPGVYIVRRGDKVTKEIVR